MVRSPWIPSAYSLKQIVQRIKASAVSWAGWDPEFLQSVRKLMEEERETLAKRFAGRATAAGRSPS